MTGAEYPVDHNDAINDFLEIYEQELKLQAAKLARFYGIDDHELLSRTVVTVWKKWSSVPCALPINERYKHTLRILYNHARNLFKIARRNREKCDLLPGEELESLTHATTIEQDPVAAEAISEDGRLAIYKAISLLEGRCKDVMALIALGLENSEVRQELGMTETNLRSTKARACKLLREILGSEDKCEGGEPR